MRYPTCSALFRHAVVASRSETQGIKMFLNELGPCYFELTQIITVLPEYIFILVAMATGGHIGIQNGRYRMLFSRIFKHPD